MQEDGQLVFSVALRVQNLPVSWIQKEKKADFMNNKEVFEMIEERRRE